VLPDDLPHVTGSVGLIGTRPSDDMMQGCDTLLMVGTGFPYAEWLPEPGAARAVQIDIDGARLGIRYPNEVNLVGDARQTLQALLPLLRARTDGSWREGIEAGVAQWWRTLAERAHASAEPVNPQLVFHELSARLPDRAIVLADSGSSTVWWARHLRLRAGMDAALSGTLASMGPAVPYALAAKLAHPDRPVIACLGDGAMQMLGMNGLIDLAAYAHRWSGPLVVLVVNNGDLNMVTWEQRRPAGDAKQPDTQNLPPWTTRRSPAPSGSRASGWSVPRTSGRRGTARSPPAGRWSSTPSATRRSRSCRRASAPSTPRASPARSCTGTRGRRGSCPRR
jgi:pyruvate dehydrogenase (quinone)